MKPPLCFVPLVLALYGGLSAASFAASRPPQQAVFESPQMFFQLSGTCAMDVAPDQALIVGGVSSSALQPSDAVDQLEKQIALMRTFIAEKKGSLELLERVRTLKNPQPGRQENEPPFQVIQRLRVAFPADAPVDAILQRQIELGFDRFGDNVVNNYNRREVVIRFHVTGLEARLKNLQQECATDAWKKWIASPAAMKDEVSAPAPPNLDLQYFNVRSKESLMRPDGGVAPWQFSLVRGQNLPDTPNLTGNVPVHLEGSIALSYHRESAKP